MAIVRMTKMAVGVGKRNKARRLPNMKNGIWDCNKNYFIFDLLDFVLCSRQVLKNYQKLVKLVICTFWQFMSIFGACNLRNLPTINVGILRKKWQKLNKNLLNEFSTSQLSTSYHKQSEQKRFYYNRIFSLGFFGCCISSRLLLQNTRILEVLDR